MWPRCAKVVASTTAAGRLPEDLWDVKAAGQIVPNGAYNSSIGIVEYFYGLAGPLNTNASAVLDEARVTKIEHVWSACNYTTRIVSLETFITFATGRGVPLYTIDIIHVYRFNKQRRICGFSLTSKRQGLILASVLPKPDDAEGNTAFLARVCGGIQAVCTGPNQQHDSFEACMAFMATIPMGNPDYYDQNNVMCRSLHLQLALADPTAHCPHTGPSGGGKCIDHGVESLFAIREYLACD